MIKICSLDLLNREFFETDIMTVDGKVLFNATDKITSSLILKLYFKNIYVSVPLVEKENESTLVRTEASTAKTNAGAIEANFVSKTTSEEKISESEAVAKKKFNYSGEISEAKTSDLVDGVDLLSTDDKTSESTESLVVDLESMNDTSIKKSINSSGTSESAIDERSSMSERVDSNLSNGANPRSVSFQETEDSVSGPRSVGADTVISSSSSQESSGPKSAGLNFDTETSSGPKSMDKNISDVEIDGVQKILEVEEIDSELSPLEFDEAQAKRIVAHSVKIAKMLNFSDSEIKELEQVAYYCNIGITSFKKADLAKKNFRQIKTIASYEMLLAEKKVSEKIAEMVSFCATNYEGSAFPLNQKIPCHDIVAISSYYEELLTKNNSKEKTLLKMLQLGGNKFNIFILHKFIKMMKEDNE